MAAKKPGSLDAVLRVYFSERDTILSPDGILRTLSVISCIVCAALHVAGGRCGGSGLAAGAAGMALGGAFVLTILSVLAACGLPPHAPLVWLCVELVSSTVVGGLLVVSGLLMISMCDVHTTLDYLHAPFALLSSALAVSSAVVVYSRVSRHWDRAQSAARASPPPPTTEHDV